MKTIYNFPVFLAGIFLSGSGMIATGVKLAVTPLVIMDDDKFWIPIIITILVGFVGLFLIWHSTKKPMKY
jgi:hypothetical protein